MNRKKIAVIFGGISPEHEVSFITSMQALQNIDKEKFEAFPVYVSKDGTLYTGEVLREIESYKNLSNITNKAIQIQPNLNSKQSSFTYFSKSLGITKQKFIPVDVIFSCFHGGLGENGGFPGLFEIMNIPYVGPGILSSSVGMDKVVVKNLFAEAGLPQTSYQWFYRNDWEDKREEILNKTAGKLIFPLFVKPANGGSTVGVTKVKDKKALENAMEVAFLFDRKVIVEEGFAGREINISVLGNSGSKLETSVCEEVFPSEELLSYEDKYASGSSKAGGMASTKREIPAKIKNSTAQKVEEIAKTAFKVLDLSGVSRIDFIVNEEKDKLVILEANTIPGSLSFYLWEPKKGMKFKELLTRLIELSLDRYSEQEENTKSFPSNILENFKPSSKSSKL